MERRVVITGLGAITPIGKDVNESWNSILNKKCGIDNISLFDSTNFKTKLDVKPEVTLGEYKGVEVPKSEIEVTDEEVDAEVKNYESQEYFDLKQSKRLDRSSQFAIIASREAFKDSGITKENTDFERVGVFVSSGIAGLSTIQEQCAINCTKGHNRISPMFIPMSIANMPSGNIAIEFGFKGESISILSACASSTHAIGEAYKTIKLGLEDVVIAGGAEAAICEVGIAGFENMKALSFETDKNRASIPFDKRRNGFVMGEGAGIVVLEELEHAKRRNAKIYGEIIGFGATTDAYHITSPCPDGEGGARAMQRALDDAKISANEVDYINAHGTSTHLNDLTETLAIKKVFGNNTDVMVSSTKGNTGHLLGAAGAVEAIICTKAMEEGIGPPNINYKEKDEECDLNLVVGDSKKENLNIVLSNSLGFGGHNACIAIKKFED